MLSLTLLLSLILLPLMAVAQSTSPEKIGSADTLLSVFSSLLIVVGVIVSLGFLMKRFNMVQSKGAQLHIVASMVAGTRERVVVIQVGEEQHLLGITPHNINHLAKLEQPIESELTPDLLGSGMRNRFAQILQKQQSDDLDHDSGQNKQQKKD